MQIEFIIFYKNQNKKLFLKNDLPNIRICVKYLKRKKRRETLLSFFKLKNSFFLKQTLQNMVTRVFRPLSTCFVCFVSFIAQFLCKL